MKNKTILLCLWASFCSFGFSPVGTVTCPEGFSLDGQVVSVSNGISSFPLTVGDEVATLSAPAVLVFADGSSVKLAAGSRAKLIGSNTQPKLVLLAGSLDYKVVLGSNLSVTSLDLERKAGVAMPLRTDEIALIGAPLSKSGTR